VWRPTLLVWLQVGDAPEASVWAGSGALVPSARHWFKFAGAGIVRES
jgi:hypothetical protein